MRITKLFFSEYNFFRIQAIYSMKSDDYSEGRECHKIFSTKPSKPVPGQYCKSAI